MRRRKLLKKKNQAAIVDMDDFLVTYGAVKLGAEKKDLSQTIYNSGKNNLKGLDKLFKDHGFGRIHKFEEIAGGFVRDVYEVNGSKADSMAKKLYTRAFKYLGAHANQFNHWKQS